MSGAPVERMRALCLALSEVTERLSHRRGLIAPARLAALLDG